MKTNGHFKIEKGVPIPEARGGKKKGELAVTLLAMKKGDSVLAKDMHYQNVIQHCARYLGRGNYTIRHTEAGLRIWRTG